MQQCSANAGYNKLSIQQLDEVGVIYLNSPKDLNALNSEMKAELVRALKQLDTDDKTKVIVILSKLQKAFCAGADIKEFANLNQEALLKDDIFQNISQALSYLKKPLVIGVNALALGGGCELALAADVILCSEDASFGLPELTLGLIPGLGGTQRLTHLIGKVNSSYHIFTSDRINAKRAYELGLVTEVVSKDKLEERVLQVASKIAEKSMYTLIVAKDAIKHSQELGISKGIDYERTVFFSLFNTKGKEEGVSAFIQKRKANFKGI